ncbi:tRNA preQ1(34) S-adenosylmethionine ribosyltransferase-isomerase QueA [bacterium]|nr:tRNA preQ1(34) S-adenosylmethionine ribosyltransferase-isomerase QueA [bacterium]
MKLSELKFDYPEELIATTPARPTRVMWVGESSVPIEISLNDLIEKIPAGDVLVINNTKVLRRRVFTDNEVEVLFLDKLEENESSNTWKVLFPSKKYSTGDILNLPKGFKMELIEKGRPQVVKVTPAINDNDFAQIGELPLPPYIQKARNERHNVEADESWYQTAWAEVEGSHAAPTASLHFTKNDIETLKAKGVHVVDLTLHVGLGTFLPVTVEDLNDHQMHFENYEISPENWNLILESKIQKKHIWALGTTTTRVLESVARTNRFKGTTNLLLQPGSDFNIVDRLLTNFHQPESTLLALVAGFSGLDKVQNSYKWAIQNKFRLFSYGDLSVWLK